MTVSVKPSAGPLVPMLRVKAVAQLVDVHVSTVYRAIESGALTAVRIGQGQGGLRVPSDAVQAWLSASVVRPAGAGVAS